MRHEGQRARQVMAAMVLVTAVLYAVPALENLAYPLLLLSTLAHEMGHGIAAILVGGSFESFVLYSDGSGVALNRGNFGPLSTAFIAAGGLVGPAVVAAVLFVMASRGFWARMMVIAMGLGGLISALLVVRNLFGLVFVIALSLICLLLARWTRRNLLLQSFVAFLAVQLALSVFSRGDYLFTDVAITAAGPAPSDVSHIADALLLPYWFWGALCGLLSLAALGFGLRVFWRATAPGRAMATSQ